MLTEGTDVPNAQTVFLSRQTTSRILLTQMIGRALRGPKFGGTEKAYIVAFIDDWKQHINWARWDDLLPLAVKDNDMAPRLRPPLEFISIELVSLLARELDVKDTASIPFLTLLPVGWYAVSYDTSITARRHPLGEATPEDNEVANDDIEIVHQLRAYPENRPTSLTTFRIGS